MVTGHSSVSRPYFVPVSMKSTTCRENSRQSRPEVVRISEIGMASPAGRAEQKPHTYKPDSISNTIPVSQQVFSHVD